MTTTGGLRYKFCPDCSEMHDVHEWPGNHRRPDEALATPSVISDVMSPTQSMGNGRLYDSKSAIRAHYKRDGLVEVGNDPARNRPRPKVKPDRKSIRDSVHKAEARFNRGERTSDAMKFK